MVIEVGCTVIRAWTKDQPIIEGWYFWRKRSNQKDPWKWDAIYIMKDSAMVMSGGFSFWMDGTDCYKPKGGWWSSIDLGVSK